MFALRFVALFVLVASLVGCAPARENVGEGTGGGDSYQTALVARDPYTGTEYELLYVFLVDADYDCSTIIWDWGLAWWNLSSDVNWVTAVAYKGQFVDWESSFRSQYQWNLDGVWDYSTADFFYGNFGTGSLAGSGGDDDDDDVPPPMERDQEGTIANDVLGAEDTMRINSWGDDRVRGTIASVTGDWYFDAENCGYMDGGVVGGADGDQGTSTDEEVP